MDKTNIQALLRKFYAGETSDAEEAQLMDFFATSPDAADFPTDRACFASLLGAKAENAPRDLEANLDAMLSGLAKAESKTGFRLWRSPLRSLVAAAAVLLFTVVGITIYKFVPTSPDIAQQEERPQTIDTYDNPEQAMAMAETALLTFSKKLNKGLRPLEKDKASSNSLNTVH